MLDGRIDDLVVSLFFLVKQLDSVCRSDVEVRIVSIPGDWFPPVPGTFIKETMNNLADLGEKMGADPSSWSTEPPQF